jgi:VanZ family protein
MRRVVQATGWVLLFTIVVVSVVPPELRPETILPHMLEHSAIYFLAGSALGLSYLTNLVAWLVGLSGFALVIEIAQLWIPGRHARMYDFVIDAFAICLGLGVGRMLASFKSRVLETR